MYDVVVEMYNIDYVFVGSFEFEKFGDVFWCYVLYGCIVFVIFEGWREWRDESVVDGCESCKLGGVEGVCVRRCLF